MEPSPHPIEPYQAPEPPLLRRSRALATGLAGFAGLIGAVALGSRLLLGADHWATSLGFEVRTQPNTAAVIIALALAVVLGGRDGRAPRLAAQALGLASAALGLATLVQHLAGLDLGVDLVLLRVEAEPGVTTPGRMGPPAALQALVLGVAVALRAAGARRRRVLAAWLAGALLPLALLAIVGYSHGAGVLYTIPSATAVALPTAIALAALELGVALEPGPATPFAVIWSSGPGGALTRSFLPWALVFPPLLGAAALTIAAAHPQLAISCLSVALTVGLLGVLLRSAHAIDRLHAARERALADRLASREELARALAREREARALAERAGKVKDEVLATLAHELRTPLNAMLGWAGLLRGAAHDPAKLARGLEVVERNGRALARHVSDLLDMSRLAAGALSLKPVEVDLAAVLDREVSAAEVEARAKGVGLGAVSGLEPITVRGDPSRLAQILAILLGNAVKFTPPGGRVDVRGSIEGGQAQVVVSDTGVGIRPEVLPSIFEPFVQADGSASRVHGGLGLGLAIAQRLAALHGGQLRAESDGPGRGATFRLTLPLVRADAPGLPAPGDLTGARVLVVEDDDDSRDLLVELLRSWGADARGTGSAGEALAALERERHDLVVSDLAMPGLDGTGLVVALRALERGAGTARVPVAALTAFGRPEDRERALAVGFDAHLAKPVEPEALRATLAGLLAGARQGAGAARVAR